MVRIIFSKSSLVRWIFRDHTLIDDLLERYNPLLNKQKNTKYLNYTLYKEEIASRFILAPLTEDADNSLFKAAFSLG